MLEVFNRKCIIELKSKNPIGGIQANYYNLEHASIILKWKFRILQLDIYPYTLKKTFGNLDISSLRQYIPNRKPS